MAGILRTPFDILLAVLMIAGASTVAEPALKVTFDGPETRWQAFDNRAARVIAHQCVPDGIRNAAGAERIAVAAPLGQPVLFGCATGRMPLIDEFRVRLWVKTSRPGAQLAARAVLPRSIDPKTGAVVTAILRGPVLQQVGHWQQLDLAAAPKLLANQVRVLRAGQAAAIDPREAYVDAIVLAVPGDPQGCEVLTDELEVEGVVIGQAENNPRDANAGNLVGPKFPPTNSIAQPTAVTGASSMAVGWRRELDARAPRVRMQGTSLLVDGKPFATRAVEWNGEPLEFLALRGFNAVSLRDSPTAELLAEAARHDLWLICPPPAEAAGGGASGDWERVLVWRLEDPAAQDDAAHFRNWAELVRGRGDLPPRPVLVAPHGNWTAMSYCADLVLGRHPLDASLAPAEFGEWLTACRRLARPGTPLWASIGTQFGEGVRAQAASLSRKTLPALSVDDDHLESAVRVATTRGCRGFLFRSNSPLNESDPATRRRAALVELVNRHLQLIEPWIAGGVVTGEPVAADGPAEAVVLSVDRARLLVPISREQGAGSRKQNPPGTDTSRSPLPAPCSFVVPSIPDFNQVFLLTPTALRPLTAKRVAGGSRLTLDSADDDLVIISQEPQLMVNLRQRIARDGPATHRLEAELARLEAGAVGENSRSLARLRYDCRTVDNHVAAADGLLRQADGLLAAGRLEQAHSLLRAARRQLQQAIGEQRRIVGQAADIGSYPLSASYDTLVAHAEFLRNLDTLRGGENLLYGGDFESLDQLTQFGWQHIDTNPSGTAAQAELSNREPYHGGYCLRLNISAPPEGQPSASADRSGIRIVSPPIQVEAGQWVEITGWVRIPEPTPGQGTELEIADSLGGPELSLPLRATAGWQPFHIVRAATANEFSVSFGLGREGTAELDAVMVRPLRVPLARRLPPIGTAVGR
jgi:hypothetical protein